MFVVLAAAAQLAAAVISTSPSVPGLPICTGTKAIGDTVSIVTERKSGAREQSIVEARLAIVSRGNVIGTMYIDDQGMRYVEIKRGATVPGLSNMRGDGTVHPLGTQQILGGEARLQACRGGSG